MTEDMVQAHAEHISSLKEGSERTEAQLGLLRSDMQAFKVLFVLFCCCCCFLFAHISHTFTALA